MSMWLLRQSRHVRFHWWAVGFLLLTSSVHSRPVPTGPDSWRDSETGRTILALGPGVPVNYQGADGTWEKIDPNWQMVTASRWQVIRGVHHAYADGGGQAYFIAAPHAGRHILGTRTIALIGVNPTDTSWVEIDAVSGRTGRVRGNQFTYADIVPGVDKILAYETDAYREHFVFTRGLLQRLTEQGVLGPGVMLGTATRLDMDSLGLTLLADGIPISFAGAGTIVPSWVEAQADDSTVWCIAEAFLETPDSVTDIRVLKWFVQREDGAYLVEMFDAAQALAVNASHYHHDAWFGSKTTGTTSTSIENTIVGSPFTCPLSGYADSITAYISISGASGSPEIAFALYEVDSTGGTFVDSTFTRAIPVDEDVGYAWEGMQLEGNPGLTSGTRYFLVAWSESGSWGSNIRFGADTGDTVSFDLAQTFGTWPGTFTRDFNYANFVSSIYLTYTLEDRPRRRLILLKGGN